MDDACDTGSPILINLDDNGSDGLTSAENGVLFDLNNAGTAVHTGWTAASSRVGFLVMDRNGNGRIDNGSELFGSATPKRDGSIAKNGFEALIDLDQETGSPDGLIDRRDPSYSALRLWIDANHNGYSEPSELFGLDEVGIKSISTAYTMRSRVDGYGNQYRFEGEAQLVRDGHLKTRRVFDVFFKVFR